MGVRNCKELGENLQLIVKRLMANDNLVNLLYYNDIDPLNQPHLSPDEKNTQVFNKLIKIIPKVTDNETAKNIISIKIVSGAQISDNMEFKNVEISIEVFTPWEQWMIKNSNLRPFAILGEIQSSLEGKTVNGLGKLQGGDFSLSFLTQEISCYEQVYTITSYD